MPTIADSAVGAILEIPPATLNQIYKAQRAIEGLQMTSKHAAEEVSKHWGTTAVDGLNKFIQALKNAQGEISNFKTNDININIKPAEQKLNDVSNSAKKTADDVSRSVYRLVGSDINFTNFVELDRVIRKLGFTYEVLAKDLKDFETQRKGMQVNDPETQEINRKIEALKEYLRVKKQSETRQQYSTTTVDRDILSEQKRLLQDQINLQKQLNEQKIKVKSGGITENANLEKEKKDLEDLRNKYIENGKALRALAQEKKNLSDAGSRRFELNAEKQTNQILEQQRRYRQDLNKELNKTRELTSATQVSKATISSRDESQIQRQLNNDYSAMIRIIREVGKVKADAAKEGRATNQQEDALIKTLWERYRGFAKEVLSIQNSYAALGRARAEAFRNDRSEQLARNAVMLAEAQAKATQAAEKQARALHDISPVIQAYNQINSQIERETNLLQQVKDKAAQATQEFQNWKNLNPTFDFSNAMSRLQELTVKIDEIKAKAASQGPTKASITMAAAKPLQAEYDALNKTLAQFFILMDKERWAIDNVDLAMQKYTPRLEALRGESNRLSQEIERLASANAKFNSELSKGNDVKSLSTEYKNLVTTIQRLGEQMNAFRTAGGDTSSASYRAMMSELQKLVAREKEIRMMSINEVEAYRQERAKTAYQADLSAFVQNEAQKKIEQQKTMDEQVAKAKIAGQQWAQSFQGAWLQYAKLMSGSGKGKLSLNLENIKRVLGDLQAAAGKLNLLDPNEAQKATDLKTAIQKLNGMIKNYKDITTAKPNKPVISSQDAINAAKSATSLKQLQDAYKNLKAVMSTLDPKSDIWKQMNAVLGQTKTQIDKIRKQMGELQSQSKRTGDVLSQLKGQLGAAFSIAAIGGYIKKMVEVRAQFELQNVALRAILQNKDEADRIFMQVQQMALQSPFTIMQLTTYTKQLAAYRIEANKLVGTTKMLADVSAGLAVSIDRLILAYGQVKSANYLRATEVRQFTEAGLNIAGELANYFSELQGKMISVGDVMEMITKRMVRFEDVEEVFKRVTSAGGLFYDMQKKQAETLKGQMQRITDAYNIMLNEIGKSNQSNISKALKMIRSLISQWRVMVPLIETVGAIMAAVFIPKAIIAMVRSITSMNLVLATTILRWKGINDKIMASNLAMKTTVWGAVISAAITLTAVLIGVNDQLNAVNDELGRIRDEGATDMYNLIYKYQDLANTLSSTTTSYEKQKEALDELQRTYKDMLPSEMLEIENIRAMSDGYEAVTNAIREYSIEKTKQKSMEAIDTSQREQFNEWQDKIVDKGWKVLMKENNIDTTEEELRGRIRSFTDMMYQEIQDGTLKTEDALIRFSELFAKYYGLSEVKITGWFKDYFDLSSRWSIGGVDNLNKIIERFDKKRAEIEAQFDQTLTFKQRGQMLAAKPQTEQYEALSKAMDDYAKAIRAVKDEGGADIFNAQMDSLSATQKNALDGLSKQLVAINQLRGAMGLIPLSLKDIQAAMDSNMDVEAHLREVSQQTLKGMLSDIEEFAKATKNDALVAWVENMRRELEKVDLNDTQKQIQNVILEVEKANNVNLGDFRWALLDSNSTVSSVAADVKKEVKSLQESIKKYETTVAEGLPAFLAQLFFLGGKTLEEVKETLNVVDELSKKLGNSEKQKKGSKGKDPILKTWEDRLDALKRYYDAAEKERQNLSESETREQHRYSFEQLWKELGFDKVKGLSLTELMSKGFNPDMLKDQYVEALKILKAAIPGQYKDLKKKVEEVIASESVEIQFKLAEKQREELQKDIDDLFANMELTKTFADLGLNLDLTYIVGGKPTTLADVRKQLESMSADMAQKSLEEQKIYQKALETLRKKEHDNQIARIKNYNKYLLESMSERVQIELKAMQEINKIRNDETLDQFSKDQAVINRRKKMQEDLTKFDFDQFKGSDVYIDTFKDLEKASKEQLQYVIDKLKELQSVNKDLSPVQVKSIANEIRKAQDALGDKTSFVDIGKNLKESINYAKNRNQLLKEQVVLQQNIDSQNKNLSSAEKKLYDLTLQRDSIQDKNSEEWKTANAEVKKQQMLVSVLISSVANLKKKQGNVTKEISEGEQAWINFKGGLGKVNEAMAQIKEPTDTIFAGLDSMGLVPDSFKDTYESISDIIGGVQTAMEGLASIDITKPFSVITGLGKAIGGIFSSIGGIFGMGDKKKERQIKRLQERVEDLDKAYQKLEKSIEAAYTFDQYNAGYKQMQQSLESQKAAYEEMIRLEEAKKKNDKDKVKEYQQQLDEINEALEDQKKKRYEIMGSVSEEGYRSEAENYVSAWLDAYKETGDGLDALTDHWQEFYENLVMKQAASAVVSKRMSKYIDLINAAIDSGETGLSLSQTFRAIGENLKSELGVWNEDLKAFFDALGFKGGAGEFVLSDLQKGIQNITKPQAAAIEAYLNSMRFAVFKHTEQLDTLIASVQAQYGSGAENPVVTELKGIRSELADMHKTLRSVIDNRVGRGASIRIAG